MIPLKELQKKYPDAKYIKVDGKTIVTLVKAKALIGTRNWFDEENIEMGFEEIPVSCIDQANSLLLPKIDRSLVGDIGLSERASRSVFPAQITGIIESAPLLVENETSVVFEDMLVLEPLKPELYGMKIYVPQHKAGMTKTTNLRHMLGQTVPVKLVELQERRYSNYYLSRGIKNNYIALGDIDIAEYLKNSQLHNLVKHESKKENEVNEQLSLARKGIISQVTRSGVYVLSREFETVYIPFSKLTYKSRSRILNPRDYIERLSQISFKITLDGNVPQNRNTYAGGIEGPKPQYLTGESLSFETDPAIKLREAIDSRTLVGKTFKAHLVTYDVVKGHLIELEEFPGLYVKLHSSPLLKSSLAVSKETILVSVARAKYMFKDERFVFNVYCNYNSTLNKENKELLSSFFRQ